VKGRKVEYAPEELSLDAVSRQVEQLKAKLDAQDPEIRREELGALLHSIQELLAGISRQQQELNALAHEQQELDVRIAAVENSRIFRCARRLSKLVAEWKARAAYALLDTPLNSLRRSKPDTQYALWLQHEQTSMPAQNWYRHRVAKFVFRPFFSILLPTRNPRRQWLESAIASVEAQHYPDWELSICDDASTEPWIADYLKGRAAANPCIRFEQLNERAGISTALNRAGRASRGDYVTFLGQDGVLAPHALFHVAEDLQNAPADLIYADEDRLSSGGERIEPTFKPAWSPDLLTSCMYLGHFLAICREAIDKAGWFRAAYDGNPYYDLALRVTEESTGVRHLPRIFYHWRSNDESPSRAQEAETAGRLALEDAARRRGCRATITRGPQPGAWRFFRELQSAPLASVVIVSRNAKLLQRCMEGLNRGTRYSNRELVVVQHKTGNDHKMDVLLAKYACKRVEYSGKFNFATMNNLGADAAAGEVLVFVNDDVVPLTPEWLDALLSHVLRQEVGVAGARLVYPSGAIQHAGIVVGIMDGCGHALRGSFGGKYWDWAHVTRNVSAVTAACMAVRKKLFEELGGFDPSFPVNYNDADFCLRARKAGYEVVYEPAALLRHDECRTRVPGTAHEERMRWRRHWASEIAAGDPFYNPNLTRVREDASPRLEE
jgi:GT2 family glycosyltransferase